MKSVVIHSSGHGGDKLEIISYGNGTAYNVAFGEAGSPMHNLFFQGDDASLISDEFDSIETAFPHMETRDVWLSVLDPYL